MTGPSRVLAITIAVTALLYLVPGARILAWPLVLISTLAHELGHGLAAALLGGRFESLAIYADGGGAAFWSGAFGRLGVATVAAAGLVGPAIAAFVLLAVGRRPSGARTLLVITGSGLVLLALLLVRNPFGFWFTVLFAAACLAVAFKAPRASQGFVVFLAVQLALTVYSRSDYLFTRTAVTAAGAGPSDVAVIAAVLVLPYWFWGAVCAALSVIVLWAGAKMFFR